MNAEKGLHSHRSSAACALARSVLVILSAQEVAAAESAQSYVVRISAASRIGAGIVVAVGRERATILTASHVIAGSPRFAVVFSAAPDEPPFQVTSADTIGMQAEDAVNGLAAFRVRGPIPAGVRAATLDAETPLGVEDAEPLTYWGYPNMSRRLLRLTGNFSGTQGTLFLIDRSVGEGASGGPVVRNDRVVGVVTSVDAQFTYSVAAKVVDIALRGWGVSIPVLAPVPAPAPSEVPSPPSTCQVRIDTSPAKASVYLDDEEQGAAPLVLALTRGRAHALRVEEEGYEVLERQVDCDTGAVQVSLSQQRTNVTLAYGGDVLGCVLQLRVTIGGVNFHPSSNPFSMAGVPAGTQSYSISGQITCLMAGSCNAAGQGIVNVRPNAVYNLVWGNPAYAQCTVSLVDVGL